MPEHVRHEAGEHRSRSFGLRADAKSNAFDLLVAVAESESESLDDLLDAIAEPLDAVTASAPGGDRCLRPVIERLCRDLGLPPEWSRRVGEGWEAGYFAGRPRFNPFSKVGDAAVLARAQPGLDAFDTPP